MKTLKKSLYFSVVLVLVLAIALVGCSKNNDPGEQQSSPPPTNNSEKKGNNDDQAPAVDGWVFGSEPLEFTFYGNYGWYDMPPWESTEAGKWLKEQKKLNVVPISAGGDNIQKLNTMIASNELPDMIWGDRGADVERLRQAGMLVPFDDYLDKYPNLKTWMGDDLNMLRSEDGKLYQFPNWYSSRPFGNAGYVVNKKIYEELGSPALETTDDLYAYLNMVKEKYPKVIPFEPHRAVDNHGLGVLYTAFGGLYSYLNANFQAVPQGDQLVSIFTDPTFREAQKYIAKLFREKLIAQDAFTQTVDQITEKVMQGRVAVFASSSPTTIAMEAHTEMVKSDPNSGYFMIWPIHKPGLDKNKIYPGTYTSLGWNVSVITTAAKDPEKIFAFLDWYTGPEGQSLLFFGPEGGFWDGLDANGSPIFNDSYDAVKVAELQTAHDPIMWNGNTAYIDPVKAAFELTLPVEKQSWNTKWQMEITWPTQYNVTEFINMDPLPDSEEGIINQRINDIFLEAMAKSVMSKSDAEVDAVFDKAQKDAETAGYQKLLDHRTKVWQANKKRLSGN